MEMYFAENLDFQDYSLLMVIVTVEALEDPFLIMYHALEMNHLFWIAMHSIILVIVLTVQKLYVSVSL